MTVLSSHGLDVRGAMKAIRGVPRFVRDLRAYRRGEEERFPLRSGALHPILSEFGDSAGTARGHYFHQDLWAARKIFARRPREHLDIGSRIDGFIAHLLSFMPVKVIDIRPIDSNVEGLIFLQGDATDLVGWEDGSIDSISSLHAIEHFGLGRYGDPIDNTACFRAMHALERVLSPGGRLYFSVPIGRQRVEFNAHRIFDPGTVLESFAQLELRSFSAVDDAGDFHADVAPERFRDARFACGLFEFTKPAN